MQEFSDMSQCERIARYLQRGRTLTPLSALRLFDCLRLGGRIHQLRGKGYRIKTDIIEISGGKRIARYSLAQKKAPGVVS
ncbi:MAG: helix-turn-helix domain-containing protein [Terriglobia bacterium]|nr:helix-turn-helix domain-containing protein [Terriglobia bacterium]